MQIWCISNFLSPSNHGAQNLRSVLWLFLLEKLINHFWKVKSNPAACKKVAFHAHFYLRSRQQQNITTNLTNQYNNQNITPYSSNQINWYNDSEFYCGDKVPGICMDVLNRCSHAHWFIITTHSSNWILLI